MYGSQGGYAMYGTQQGYAPQQQQYYAPATQVPSSPTPLSIPYQSSFPPHVRA